MDSQRATGRTRVLLFQFSSREVILRHQAQWREISQERCQSGSIINIVAAVLLAGEQSNFIAVVLVLVSKSRSVSQTLTCGCQRSI